MKPRFKIGEEVVRVDRYGHSKTRIIDRIISPYSVRHEIGYEWHDKIGPGEKCSEARLLEWKRSR